MKELNIIANHECCTVSCTHHDYCLSPCDLAYDECKVGLFAKERCRK